MVCEVLATVIAVILQSFMIAELGPSVGEDIDGCGLGVGVSPPSPHPP